MIVETDQPRTLRDQQMLPGLGVEDGLAHLRDQLPWKVRVQARQEHRGDDRPNLDLVRAHRSADDRRKDLGPVRRSRGLSRGRRRPACCGLGRREGGGGDDGRRRRLSSLEPGPWPSVPLRAAERASKTAAAMGAPMAARIARSCRWASSGVAQGLGGRRRRWARRRRRRGWRQCGARCRGARLTVGDLVEPPLSGANGELRGLRRPRVLLQSRALGPQRDESGEHGDDEDASRNVEHASIEPHYRRAAV